MSNSYTGWDGEDDLVEQLKEKGYGELLDTSMDYELSVGKGEKMPAFIITILLSRLSAQIISYLSSRAGARRKAVMQKL